MTVAGDIVANLTANTKGWSAGLQSAITPLAAFATAVTGMAAAGVYKFNEIGSALDDMSQRTGVAAETLSALRYATNQTDTSMDALQAGLVKQGKFMSELDGGSRSAAATLAKLGLSTGDLAGKTADQRFLIFADRLTAIDDVGERSAVAMQVFGRRAADLVPLLSQGSAGIQSMIDEAERLGLVMSQEDVSAAAEFGDTLDRLVMVGEMFLVKVVSPLVPLLTATANMLANAAGENGEWLKFMVQTGVVIGSVIIAVKGVSIAIQAYTKSVAIATALSGPKGWAMLAVGLAAAGAATYALNSQFEGMNDTTEKLTASRQSDTVAIHEQAAAQDDLAKRITAANSVHENLNRLMLTPAQQAINDARQLGEQWRAANKVGSTLGMRFEELQKLQRTQLENKSGFSGAFADVTDELRVLRGEITETELKFEQMAEFGVSDRQIGRLREAMAERDRIVAEQEAKQNQKRETDGRVKSTADLVKSSLETPLDRFLAQASAVEEAINAGAISSNAGQRFLDQERQKLLDSQEKPETIEERRAAITEAISIRSDAANRQMVDLLNRRGGGQSIDEKRLALEQKNKELNEQMLAAMNEVKENTAKPQLATRPFGGRG